MIGSTASPAKGALGTHWHEMKHGRPSLRSQGYGNHEEDEEDHHQAFAQEDPGQEDDGQAVSQDHVEEDDGQAIAEEEELTSPSQC